MRSAEYYVKGQEGLAASAVTMKRPSGMYFLTLALVLLRKIFEASW